MISSLFDDRQVYTHGEKNERERERLMYNEDTNMKTITIQIITCHSRLYTRTVPY
jgi:hypothetical protein